MQDKLEHFEHFNQLPNVIKGEITKFLPTKEFINLSMTSKSNHNLFRTNQYLALLQEARKFLHHVVRGNHVRALISTKGRWDQFWNRINQMGFIGLAEIG